MSAAAFVPGLSAAAEALKVMADCGDALMDAAVRLLPSAVGFDAR